VRQILITTSSFDAKKSGLLQSLTANGFDCVLNPYGRKLTEAEVAELVEQHQPIGMIAGVESLTRRVLEKAGKLKIISRAGIGMDSVDLQAARDLGVVVTNTPDAPTIPVAELTLGLILSLLRRIHVSDAGIRRGDWVRPMGNLLHGKTVGIIGCGRIGTYLAGLLSSFGCIVLGYDPFINRPGHFQPEGLEQILSDADIISLHIPYNKDNHHFINAHRMQSMKKSALLINAARGGLVDEDALYNSLCSGHLRGAALDCFEQEPYTGELKDLDNVLLTAHIGAYAQEGRNIMEKQAVENLLRELKQAGCIK
jgi:D-3-phosphoglycerate dehydrogenase / 2-oxoglutarate reductase